MAKRPLAAKPPTQPHSSDSQKRFWWEKWSQKSHEIQASLSEETTLPDLEGETNETCIATGACEHDLQHFSMVSRMPYQNQCDLRLYFLPTAWRETVWHHQTPQEFYVAKYPYTQGAQRVGEYFCISQKMRMGLDTKPSVGLSLLNAPKLLKSSSNIHFSWQTFRWRIFFGGKQVVVVSSQVI